MWWCKQHDPEAIEAREQKRSANYRAESAADAAVIAMADAYLARLGVKGRCPRGVDHRPRHEIAISFEAADDLVRRLTETS